MEGIMRNWYHSKYYKGIKAITSHEEGSYKLIQSVVSLYKPELMIELGTAYYGLTLVFHEACPDVPLFTFDKYNCMYWMKRSKGHVDIEFMKHLRETAFNEHVHFCFGNLIKGLGHPFVILLLKLNKKKLLYCDNGKKMREVIVYSKYLKSGDLLGMHDWGYEIGYEFSYAMDGIEYKIADILSEYTPHPMNRDFEGNGCSSRWFIKK